MRNDSVMGIMDGTGYRKKALLDSMRLHEKEKLCDSMNIDYEAEVHIVNFRSSGRDRQKKQRSIEIWLLIDRSQYGRF